jgi:hypothetical protein
MDNGQWKMVNRFIVLFTEFRETAPAGGARMNP